MELSQTALNIIMGILVVLVLVANVYFRKRKMEKEPLGKVVVMLADLDKNYKLTENFSFHRGIQKQKTGNWKKHRNAVDFLPVELRTKLDRAFEMSEDVNERIDAARKHGSDSYMAGIDIDKLKEPIDKSRQELREWLQENINNPEFASKRRGLFG
jgi:hypothetical protein